MNNESRNIIENCAQELVFKTSRSGGSGGQHVNKVETKVSLRWDFTSSLNLTEEQKVKILEGLSGYVNNKSVLILNAEEDRSQLKNKEIVVKKWEQLIHKTFVRKKIRKPSLPSQSSIEKRKKLKTSRSEIKEKRKKPNLDLF